MVLLILLTAKKFDLTTPCDLRFLFVNDPDSGTCHDISHCTALIMNMEYL